MEKFTEEFSSIYRDYRTKIKKLCLGYTHSGEEAEDLVQETFLSAWKHWPNFKGQSSRTTWIYRIAVNKCLSHIKKTNKRTDIIRELALEPKGDEDSYEAIKQLYDAIGELEKVDRLVITMFLEELAYKEIAEILGIRENTVAVKIHRIKNRLTEIYNRNAKL